ncbi:MAG TPA: amylo-alpha-1,6-glucosidase [Chitinophagaceae bacterium]|nr:amylo-alpha-1,6-glucosidase [Chitinophagaceae bacterium]
MLTLTKPFLQDYSLASQHEWLETNGLGGWSGSTVIGANTRRYHGLLVAAVAPPTGRMVLLSKLDEAIVAGDNRFELGVNLYAGNTIHPRGHEYIDCFRKDIFPEWEYEVAGIRLKKTIAMIHGENTIVINYEVLKAAKPFTIELRPFIAARDYHALARQGNHLHWDATFSQGIFHNKPDGETDLFISIPGSSYRHNPCWHYNFQYSAEQYRGLDCNEDLLNHGIFSVGLKQGDLLQVMVSTRDTAGRNPNGLLTSESTRRKLLLTDLRDGELTKQLALAADQFIVKRQIRPAASAPQEIKNTDGATIIAGYHWFTDWGRDTMISIPGLCLSTGRFDEAKKILRAFAANVSMGLLPNRFPDIGEEPEYNNVDGTLWYFIANFHYLKATGDREFILEEILPVLKEIIDWHFRGTRYNIKVDADSLLFAGEQGQQLTWMDARIGDWVVTPRMGKPVEVQALWYNALRIFAQFLDINGQERDAALVNISAQKARDSFNTLYWNAKGNYLYDNIDENGIADSTLRPNQLFAISLPFALLGGERAAAVLKVIEEKLYTTVGLRTLPAEDERYVAVYGGDQRTRDGAYHQGTVWSWLLGAYIDAIMVEPGFVGRDGLSGKKKALKIISDFKYHLKEACIGSVSEIFDADAPHHPRGCVAQAWGVAEILRVVKKYKLSEAKIVHKEKPAFILL